MVTDNIVRLCNEHLTLSRAVAVKPDVTPGDHVKQQWGHFPRDYKNDPEKYRQLLTDEDIEKARGCGKWGPTNPSPLFLRAFADAIGCLESDPMGGMVSPSLMGTYGTCPLTVIAPLVDIIRHVSNLIARAEKEVFFVTCTWAPSVAQRLVTNALLELSARAEKRKQRVVVKIMFDQVGLGNAFDPHQLIKPSAWHDSPIFLPRPENIPWVDLEVMGLHKLPLGTLHCKFCVVDKKIAAVMSNNMEDNANMEMMCHLEGPVVDSIYDTTLMTWNKTLTPVPPLAKDSAPAMNQAGSIEGKEDGRTQAQIAHDGEAVAYQHPTGVEHTPEDLHWDRNTADETTRMQACYSCKPGETRLQAANRQLNLAVKSPIAPTGPEIQDGDEMTPYITTLTEAPAPMAIVSRSAYASIDHVNVDVPQNEAWLSLIRNAKESIFIQTPDLNAKPLLPALKAALERGVQVTYYVCFGYNDAGEMIPGQGGTNEQAAQRLIESIYQYPPAGEAQMGSRPSARDRLRVYYYVAKDQSMPIHQSSHTRACHIKLLIADNAVGIHGSGNMDTQSWYHSQEINVMIDSPEIMNKWRVGIERNQNTNKFGEARGDDGVWRDVNGDPGEGYTGDLHGIKGLVHGVWGMYKKGKATKG